MNRYSMTTEITAQKAAQIAGISYFMIFVIGMGGTALTLDRLIVKGDAATTIHNIMAQESLFRMGIACWSVVIVFDTLTTWALYYTLKPVDKSISLLAASFRLVFVAIFAYSFVGYFSVLELLSGASYLKAIETPLLHAQAMLYINAHEYAMHLSFIFFGLHVFFLGYLVLKSGYIPKFIGILLIVASCGYLINSSGNFLSQEYANSKIAFIIFVAVPAIVSELSLTLWLMIKGSKASHYQPI